MLKLYVYGYLHQLTSSRKLERACGACPSHPLCTTGKEKRISRWEHDAVLGAMERRLNAMQESMAIRRCTVEHVFGT